MIDNLIKELIASSDKWSFGGKEKILLFKELGNLLKGGIGIAEGLQLIGENSANFALREVVFNLREQINQGKNLSHALMRFPNYFDETDIATIQSGESAGNLDKVLLMISGEYSYINTLKKKFTGALTYPAILVTVSLGSILALFMFILPAIFEIADQFNSHELPWVTRILKDFSDYLATHGMNIGTVIILLVFALSIWLSTDHGQKKLYQFLFEVPVLGQMIKSYYLIRFSRYTKMLLESGINYRTIFKMLKSVISHPIFTPIFEKTVVWLDQGKTIYESIREDNFLIPNNIAALIKVGEQTATLPQTFETIIAIYQEELDHYIANLSKIIEPIMLIFVGGIVIMIALWVFGVIMNIMDSVAI